VINAVIVEGTMLNILKTLKERKHLEMTPTEF